MRLKLFYLQEKPDSECDCFRKTLFICCGMVEICATCDMSLVWVVLPNLFSVLMGMAQLFKIIHELVEIGLRNTHLFCFVWHQPKPS